MKFLLLAVLLMQIIGDGPAFHKETTKGNVTILPIVDADAKTYAVAVQVPDNYSGADSAVVTIFYRTDAMIGGKKQRLMLSRTSVIPIVPGAASLSDEVPATEPAKVIVTLVKKVEEQTFQ